LVKIRPHAFFEADFPDDTVWDDKTDQVALPGGQAITAAISEMLRKAGYTVTEPENEFDHGWTFDAELNSMRVWFQVQEFGECFLATGSGGFWKFTKKSKQFYAATLNTLNAALKSDPRFRKILWHNRTPPRGEVGWPNPTGED
jgi:hypothetical protein